MKTNTIDRLIEELRNGACRLKLNTDYSYTLKYSELRIFCDKVWEENIRRTCSKLKIPIKDIITYDHSINR